MSVRTTTTRRRLALLLSLALVVSMASISGAAAEHNGLHVTDLTDADLDSTDLAETLVAINGNGEDVDIVDGSVAYTGDDRAGGVFNGGADIIGFEDGILLSSGQAADVVGPNESPATSTNLGEPGDEDLTDLVGDDTNDATILEFDFEVPESAQQVFFTYVFGSDEYNQWVGSEFNDVFAFWVNDENCAVVADPEDPGETLPVSINTINHGWEARGFDPVNPDLYINNDPHNGDGVIQDPLDVDDAPFDTEMDGFTVPLVCEADVDADETNTMRMGIADTSDALLDSWVLIEAGSLTITPPEPVAHCVDLIADGGDDPKVVGEVCADDDGEDLFVTYTTFDGWMLDETHLAVSTDEPGGGEWTENGWQNRPGNPAPGQFPYSATHDPQVDEFTYTIPLADISGGVSSGDELFIGAHAVVEKEHVILEGGYFADEVDDHEQGVQINLDPVPDARSNPERALTQDYPLADQPPDDIGFFSLGFGHDGEAFEDEGGWIEVGFACPLTAGDGDDLRVWEVTFAPYPEEAADVYAWDDDAGDWVLLGTADNSEPGPPGTSDALTVSDFDLDDVGLTSTDRIRIVDTTDHELFDGTVGSRRGNADGFDLDGVQALQDCTEIKRETAWGDGDRFVDQGNWAMYFTYTVGGSTD